VDLGDSGLLFVVFVSFFGSGGSGKKLYSVSFLGFSLVFDFSFRDAVLSCFSLLAGCALTEE